MTLIWCAIFFLSASSGIAHLSICRILSWMKREEEIKKAIADYVEADLQKTWEPAANVLLQKLRSKGK
jgi:hypothetical protein